MKPKQQNPVRVVGGPYHGQVFMADWNQADLVFDVPEPTPVDPLEVTPETVVARRHVVPITYAIDRGHLSYVAYWSDGR